MRTLGPLPSSDWEGEMWILANTIAEAKARRAAVRSERVVKAPWARYEREAGESEASSRPYLADDAVSPASPANLAMGGALVRTVQTLLRGRETRNRRGR